MRLKMSLEGVQRSRGTDGRLFHTRAAATPWYPHNE